MISRVRLPFQKEKELYLSLHKVLGFYPNHIGYYKQALMHKSVVAREKGKRINNERLEFLGDAVLDLVVGDFVFHTFPTQTEGFLTEMRSRIVSRASLNKLSQKLGFEDFIKYKPDHGAGESFRSLGGNAFEALIGAIYLDKGFQFSKHIIIDRIINVHIDLEQLQQTEVNFKSRLLEWTQKRKQHLEFRLLEEKVVDHRKLYHVQIFIDGQGYADCSDTSLKRAEQIASEKTLAMLEN